MTSEVKNQLESLQNTANYFTDLKVRPYTTDTRNGTGMKTTYWLENKGVAVSPKQKYNELNNYLSGMLRAAKLLTGKTPDINNQYQII